MTFERARAVADAVLFEGYLLYPYRASAPKNWLRWQFGVLGPAGESDPSWMEAQCPLAPREGARLEGKLRFLRLERRQVEAARDGGFEAVESLEIDGQPVLTFDEAGVEEVDFTIDAVVAGQREFPFALPTTVGEESLRGGRIVRTRSAVEGIVRVHLEDADQGAGRLLKLTVRVENAGGAGSLLSTHLLLAIAGGDFVSVLDPPPFARDVAACCRSTGCYPVLAGPPGTCDLLLAAPIILYDHPQVAPESQGDLFDATEIDEILTLRTMTLTDEEKRQARATDPRAAAIIDRAERMPQAALERLHGALRKGAAT